jgi:hypothetical protein
VDAVSADLTLFDLPTRPTSDLVHVLMPCMAFACGRSILTDGGSFIVGPSQGWERVDCADCLAIGRDELAAECRRQQSDQAGAA